MPRFHAAVLGNLALLSGLLLGAGRPSSAHAGTLLTVDQEFAFAQSTQVDVSAYLIAISFADLGIVGRGTLHYEGSYSGSTDPSTEPTGDYTGTVTGDFAGMILTSKLSATRAGVSGEVGDPIYTVKSSWNAFFDVNKPPIRTFTDSGTITVRENGTADIALNLTGPLTPKANLMGTGLMVRQEVVDGITVITITGSTKTTIPIRDNSETVFLINGNSMRFSSNVRSKDRPISILNNGEFTVMQGAGTINGRTSFDIQIASVPEPSALALWLTSLPVACFLRWRFARITSGGDNDHSGRSVSIKFPAEFEKFVAASLRQVASCRPNFWREPRLSR
jgi:hypothetical protein